MRNVSITLQNVGEARPIIEAIQADNPGCEVVHMPALVKIDRAGEIVINTESVSERVGREWDPMELHMSLISLSGNIDEDDDRFVLSWQ
jgi:phenol hydroxylase P2 protein